MITLVSSKHTRAPYRERSHLREMEVIGMHARLKPPSRLGALPLVVKFWFHDSRFRKQAPLPSYTIGGRTGGWVTEPDGKPRWVPD